MKNCIFKIPSFAPESRLIITFDTIVDSLTMIELITIPLYIGFEEDLFDKKYNVFLGLRTLGYIIFSIEIIMQFNIGYYSQNNTIMDKQKIINHYFQTKFWTDLLTIMPYFVFLLSEDNQYVTFLQILFLFRYKYVNDFVNKLQILYAFTDFFQNILTLIKLCYILIYTTHLIACLWFKVGIMQKGIHWQELYLDSDNFYDKYITSFYWAITTMLTVGYGDILPTTSLEKLFAIFTMLTGCCLFAYIINSLGTIIDEIKNSDENLRKEMKQLNRHLQQNSISQGLRTQMRRHLYYIHIQQKKQMMNGNKMIAIFSKEIQKSYYQQINSDLIYSQIFFKQFDISVLESLVYILSEKLYIPDQQINGFQQYQEFQLNFVYNGKVQLTYQNQLQIQLYQVRHIISYIKQKGDAFGMLEFFGGLDLNYKYESMTFVQLQILDRQQFINILKKTNQENFEIFQKAQDDIRNYQNYSFLAINCPVCYKISHNIMNCPLIHIQVNKERIIRNIQMLNDQERKKETRKDHKYNAFKNLQINQIDAKIVQENLNDNQSTPIQSNPGQNSFSQQSLTVIQKSVKKINIDEIFDNEPINDNSGQQIGSNSQCDPNNQQLIPNNKSYKNLRQNRNQKYTVRKISTIPEKSNVSVLITIIYIKGNIYFQNKFY